MNFTATKEYGVMLRKMADMVVVSDNLKAVAHQLPYQPTEMYYKGNLALSECANSFGSSQLVLAHVVDKYVASDNLMKAINDLFATIINDKSKIDYIDSNVGDQWAMFLRMCIDTCDLYIISHTEEHTREQVQFALDDIQKRLELNEYNKRAFDHAECFMKELVQSKSATRETSTPLYIIGNDRLLLHIFSYLQETEVISPDFSLQTFYSAIERADVSQMHPLLPDKFKSSLGIIKHCIKQRKKEWLRDVCASINIVPKQASSNNTNHGRWYEDLCEIVSKQLK